MMRIALALIVCGCARHPVATVAIGGGSVGLLTCEANNASFWRSHDVAHTQATCGILAGGVALVLGGLAAVVTHFASSDTTAAPPGDHIRSDGVLRVHSTSEPPPSPIPAPPPGAGNGSDATPPSRPRFDADR